MSIRKLCRILGWLFIIVGILGFFISDLLGAHFSIVHNVIHLVSGGLALYFGYRGTPNGARGFALVFGLVYLLLGIAGFILGNAEVMIMSETDTVMYGSKLFTVIPGYLVFGAVDHVLHIVLGGLFLIGALTARRVGTGHRGTFSTSQPHGSR